ncbi:hypothetical protein JTB14_026157 [Gonioctena quinquepunctata]|nr:hypothetical protein JTB14_026157 [Gonioctena quinquepunctata]
MTFSQELCSAIPDLSQSEDKIAEIIGDTAIRGLGIVESQVQEIEVDDENPTNSADFRKNNGNTIQVIFCPIVSHQTFKSYRGGFPKKNLKRGVLPSITNDHGEEPTYLECNEDKENQNIIKGILEDINKEEKERKALVTKILVLLMKL